MNSKTIAKNSVWLGVEFAVDCIGATGTSIAVARALGPVELSYYIYINWLATLSVVLGNVGIPNTTVKYMAEYWGRNQREIARGIYQRAFRNQAGLALLISVAGIVATMLWCDPHYRKAALMLALSIFPAMINSMPSAANTAIENQRGNVPGSFVSMFLYASGVVLTLLFSWGLTGVAASLLVGRSAESIVRLTAVRTWLDKVPSAPLPPEMRMKLVKFSLQGMVLMILGVVVWDRSEVFFLKRFYPDVRHVAFYSLAFSLADNVIRLIRVFASSVAATMRAQYGRNKDGLPQILATTARYIALVAFPLFAGLAALAGPTMMVYGKAYLAAIPVLALTAILAIPKAFLAPVQAFLQSTEQQGFLVWWSVLGAVLNLTLDWLLIPTFGAMGGAWGNGLAQLFAVVGLWVGAKHMFPIVLRGKVLALIFLASAIMAAPVYAVAHLMGPITAVVIGVPMGGAIYFATLRIFGVLDEEDRDRLDQVGSSLPAPLKRILDRIMDWFFPVPRTA